VPDEQLSLFGDLGTSRHKRVLNQQQTSPVSDAAPAKPAYDHNQLQLIVNPTEQVARTHKSTDIGVLGGRERSYGLTQADIDKVGAPTEEMRRVGAVKEYEARQPVDSGLHGSGVAEIFSSGDQVRNPIEEWIEGDAPEDRRQYQGHHRLFAGAAHERDTGQQGSIWMPISYTDRSPKPPPPEKDFKGRRVGAWADPRHTDVAAGAEQVYGGPDRRVGTTEGFRFAKDVDVARKAIEHRQKFARPRLEGDVEVLQGRARAGDRQQADPKRGWATNRQDAIAAAVIYGRGKDDSDPPGMHTVVGGVVAGRGAKDVRGVVGEPRPAGGRPGSIARNMAIIAGNARFGEPRPAFQPPLPRGRRAEPAGSSDMPGWVRRRAPDPFKADSALERLLNEEESIARKMHRPPPPNVQPGTNTRQVQADSMARRQARHQHLLGGIDGKG
jgi:hypothetical protein